VSGTNKIVQGSGPKKDRSAPYKGQKKKGSGVKNGSKNKKLGHWGVRFSWPHIWEAELPFFVKNSTAGDLRKDACGRYKAQNWKKEGGGCKASRGGSDAEKGEGLDSQMRWERKKDVKVPVASRTFLCDLRVLGTIPGVNRKAKTVCERSESGVTRGSCSVRTASCA